MEELLYLINPVFQGWRSGALLLVYGGRCARRTVAGKIPLFRADAEASPVQPERCQRLAIAAHRASACLPVLQAAAGGRLEGVRTSSAAVPGSIACLANIHFGP